MAYSQLKLYNEALLLAGQRSLSSISEDREPRYKLDEVYADDSVEYCIELAQPACSRKTARLNSPTSGLTFSHSHTLPSGYVSLIEVFSDSSLNQPVTRQIVEGDQLLCDFDDIYIRYVASDISITDWDASFSKFVAAYFAQKISKRLSDEEYRDLRAIYKDSLESAIEIGNRTEVMSRPSADGGTISSDWLPIFNDALLILGLEQIADVNDDSNRRYKLSNALSADIVKSLLEDLSWQFGTQTDKLEYSTTVEPEWGYRRAFEKPSKMVRLDGIYSDEYQSYPIKQYHDEGNYFFCDIDEIWVTYISSDFLTNPSQWKSHFKRLVASRMAKDAGPSLRKEGADHANAKEEFSERMRVSKSNDAMASPPKILRRGSWTSSRLTGGTYDNRERD